MASLSSHVLDLETGTPAAALTIELWSVSGDAAELLATADTDADGRVRSWDKVEALAAGTYELRFLVEAWFRSAGRDCFYPRVRVEFFVDDGRPHYHVPVLLNRFGFSTYRGS